MATANGAAGIVSDDFYEGSGAKSPDPGWTFNNAGDANCTQTWETPGTSDSLLVLNVDEAITHLPDPNNWSAPRFTQTATSTDNFEIETKIQAGTLAASWDEAGLIIVYSGGYMICGTFRNNVSEQKVYLWRTGQTEQGLQTITLPTIPIWLRITRSGTTWTGSYDTDGTGTFTTIGSYTGFTMTPTDVGVYAGNDQSATADTIFKFDYFIETTAGDIRSTEDQGGAGPTRRIFIIT
jgi:hypothetical protein